MIKDMYSKIREELDLCNNPVFYYDDDPDGFCSFVQLYKYKGQGKGIIVKDSPKLGKNYTLSLNNFNDKVFVLDKPMVEDDFFESAKDLGLNVVWVDHHPLQDVSAFSNVKYFNSLNDKESHKCTSWMCYNAVKQNLWIAMIGIVGDWLLPFNLKEELIKQYPRLINLDVNEPDEAFFNTNLGKLVMIVSFNLKGSTSSIKDSVSAFLKIKHPYELLDNTSLAATYLIRKFNKINKIYQKHLSEAKNHAEENVLVYIYDELNHSFSKELSNNLMYLFPKHTIVVGRKHNGLVKMSLRSNKNMSEIVRKSLVGINGDGGGHIHACGAHVDINDFERFINNIKENTKKAD